MAPTVKVSEVDGSVGVDDEEAHVLVVADLQQVARVPLGTAVEHDHRPHLARRQVLATRCHVIVRRHLGHEK